MVTSRSEAREQQAAIGISHGSSRGAGNGRTQPGAARSHALYLLLCAANACVLGACGGDGPGEPVDPVPPPLVSGTYEATVTGDRSFSRAGLAIMYPLNGRLVFLMGTNPRAAVGDTVITVAVNGTLPPAIGTRAVTTYPSGETISALAVKGANTDITELFKSGASSGTLTVTQSSSGSVVGEFAVDLDGGHFPADPGTAPQHVHITGRFNAIP